MELVAPSSKTSYISGGNLKNLKIKQEAFFRTTTLLLYSVFFSCSFFSYRALNNAPHHRYLTEFWICFTS